MKTKTILIFAAGLLLLAAVGYADEYDMGEYGREEPSYVEQQPPTDGEVRDKVKDYVTNEIEVNGAFEIADPLTNNTRRLKLVEIHPDVTKSGAYYYASAMFEDMDNGETVELEFQVQSSEGELMVADTSIHSVDGKERYTYDDNHNRVPVKPEKEEPPPENSLPAAPMK